MTTSAAIQQEPATAAGASTTSERRKQTRAGVNLAVRVRPAEAKDGDFEEVRGTLNASDQGLYFTTASKCYYPGMRLRVTFPYNSSEDTLTSWEDSAEVTRADHLKDGRFGVAVLLGTSLRAGALTADELLYTTGRKDGERRLAARHPFSATVIVTEIRAKMRLQARCSDLSMVGCYVDTMNPFPEGTRIHVQLNNGDAVFEAPAMVSTCQMGMGMGIVFADLPREKRTLLASWLGPGDSVTESSFAKFRPEPIKEPRSTSDALAERLIRVLRGKGLLTSAEVAALFSDPVL